MDRLTQLEDVVRGLIALFSNTEDSLTEAEQELLNAARDAMED